MRPTEPPTPRGQYRLTSAGLAWLAAAAILGGIGWLKSLNLLLVLGYFMAGSLALNGVLAFRIARRIRCDRIPFAPVFAGEGAHLAIAVENGGDREASLEVADGSTRWLLPQVPAGQSVECVRTQRFLKRGRFALPPIVFGSSYPLGLIRFDREERDGHEGIVLPAIGQVDAGELRRWAALHSGADGQAREVMRRSTSDPADIRGVRPYRSGDSIRAIHWRSTARRRELMVREYDSAPSPELLLIVEPWLPPEASDSERANLEAALSLAATIVRTWLEKIEARLTLVVAGGAKTSVATPSGADLRELLIPLADASGDSQFAGFTPADLGCRIGQSVRLVVSSRLASPFPKLLEQSTGKRFLLLHPLQKMPWYQPPDWKG